MSPALAPFAAPRALAADPTWSIFDVARALGLFRFPHQLERRTLKGPATIVAHVAKLVLEAGFPRPLPTVRNVRGAAQLIDGVTRDSRWPQAALKDWFDDRLPPTTNAALDAAAEAAAATDMDARAANLNLRVVNGGRR